MTTKNPMELLTIVAPEFAKNQMEAKNLLFGDPRYQAVPNKYKLLAGIAVAAALGSVTCTDMWTKQALQAGADPKEIAEILQVARYMKMATVNDTISSTLEMLLDNREISTVSER